MARPYDALTGAPPLTLTGALDGAAIFFHFFGRHREIVGAVPR